MNEINKTYRLYMWISEDVVIGNMNEDYTLEEWNDVFASVKVNVSGDFLEKDYKYLYRDFKSAIETKSGTSLTDADGTIYLSGESDKINYNYVFYSGRLWRITSIYPDGSMKLVTDDSVTDMTWESSDLKFINSNVYTYLNNDFLSTLDNYQNVIVENYKWDTAYFVTSAEIGDNDYVTASVGLLNSYEYSRAYLNSVDKQANNYLLINNSWWILNNKIIIIYNTL